MAKFFSKFFLRHVQSIRLTIATVLRMAVDVVAVWLAFGLCWALVEGRQLTAVTAEEFERVAPALAATSTLLFLAYAGVGLYAHAATHLTAAAKIRRIAVINSVLFAVMGLILSGIGQTIALSTLLGTWLVSTLMLCVARMGAAVLRSESEAEGDIRVADDRKVLVIGGAGYIGSALVKKLLDGGLEVSVLDAMHFGEEPLSDVAGHARLTLIREDFRHIEALTRAISGVGAVIHLGGLVGDPACAVDPELTIDVNVRATKLIGEIAKACGVRRFIFASSCSVYGACDEIVDEGSRFNPQSLYARSKVASEVVLEGLNSPEFSVTCLRFATVYGMSGRTRFDLVVNLLCAKAVRDGVITVFGADQWRPFVHVDDVALAIMMTLNAPVEQVAGESFNVGSDEQNYTLGELAELIRKRVPDARIISDPTSVDRRNYHVSFAKIRTRLGFVPAWTLERGIFQVLRLVRSNEVGHYSLPTYSNFLYLKEQGAGSFGLFKITGWENDLMNVDRLASDKTPQQPAVA
jgi:nucleoside-diphosphate-sugar epimerase